MEEGAWEVVLKGQRFCEPCCSVWRTQVWAAFSGAGGQAQAIRPEMDPLRARCLWGGTALLFSQEKPAQRPTHALTWSAVEQKSDLPVPEAPGFGPSPAQQGLALCVASMYLDSEKSEAGPGPARSVVLGGGSEGGRGSASAECPPSTTRPPVR